MIIHALIIALVIRTFLFQPFNIPSGSMIATLLVGDYLFVSKYSYGYSHYSLPFSPPLFSGRILGQQADRGDVVVFRLPQDDSTDYIKRVIGLPGDRIQMIDGVLNINGAAGQARAHRRLRRRPRTGAAQRVKRWRETLPNGVSYTTLDLTDNGFYDNTPVYTVPPGHYFMMGDNRDNSTDSRVLSQVGYVPFENIVGKRADHLLLDRRRRAPGRCGAGRGRCAGTGCSRSCDERQPKAQIDRSAAAEPSAAEAPARRSVTAPTADRRNAARRRRGDGRFEERIGYRFKDAALLDRR